MAFGYNPYYNPYTFQTPYYAPPMPDNLSQLRSQQTPPMQQTPPQPQVAAPNQSAGFIWVQGEEGAKAFNVPANSTVLLMDSDCSSFYLKTADASGMPLPLRIFDYKERTAGKAPQREEYVTRAEFEALQADIAALKSKGGIEDAKPSV